MLHPPNEPHPDLPPIVSEAADDPDLQELIDMFVAELPPRARRIHRAMQRAEWHELANEAHKLRGSSASHGFPTVGIAAAKIEDTVRDALARDVMTLELIQNQVMELAELCSRCRAKADKDMTKGASRVPLQ
jgi:HPt (histidine-containing phosphotransfer) domain-containing protein